MTFIASAITIFLVFQLSVAQEKSQAQIMKGQATTALEQVKGRMIDSSDLAKHLIAKVIKLDSNGKDYQHILDGPPVSSTMRSGLVTLAPDKSVDKHSTEKYEELVVVFEGKGKMEVTDGDTLFFEKGEVVYCPPYTEHNVTNIGKEVLRYLYVVAEAKK